MHGRGPFYRLAVCPLFSFTWKQSILENIMAVFWYLLCGFCFFIFLSINPDMVIVSTRFWLINFVNSLWIFFPWWTGILFGNYIETCEFVGISFYEFLLLSFKSFIVFQLMSCEVSYYCRLDRVGWKKVWVWKCSFLFWEELGCWLPQEVVLGTCFFLLLSLHSVLKLINKTPPFTNWGRGSLGEEKKLLQS